MDKDVKGTRNERVVRPRVEHRPTVRQWAYTILEEGQTEGGISRAVEFLLIALIVSIRQSTKSQTAIARSSPPSNNSRSMHSRSNISQGFGRRRRIHELVWIRVSADGFASRCGR